MIKEENNCIIITNKNKWSPLGAILYGCIAGTILGVISEEVSVGFTVFGIIAVLGTALTVYERISRYQTVIVDFESKTLKAKNSFLKLPLKPYIKEEIKLQYFNFSVDPTSKKMFRKYWLNYKNEQLILLPGKETKEELSQFFNKYGANPELKVSRIGKFVANKSNQSY